MVSTLTQIIVGIAITIAVIIFLKLGSVQINGRHFLSLRTRVLIAILFPALFIISLVIGYFLLMFIIAFIIAIILLIVILSFFKRRSI